MEEQSEVLRHFLSSRTSGRYTSLGSTPTGVPAGQGPTLKPSSGRITIADKATLQESVLGYLKDKPWSGKCAIADAVGFEPQKVAVQIRSLKANGLVKSNGEKSATVYAVKGEKAKPKT